ncbi:MAG TPA: PQQ-binding-like beta-propeller repeat protein [Myxococcales bacterium]|nr:PQQ-binding-like beta-propeller repeat protein [Myxococcales bacterium]
MPPAGDVAGHIDSAPIHAASSVLQHHGDAARTGFFAVPGLTGGATHVLFRAAVDGEVYAQPLFLDVGANGVVVVATESNKVYAIDGASGAIIWSRTLAAPVPLASLPCGNIDPLGITGTPVADASSRTLYLDAMTTGPKHMVYALSLDDGSTRAGWPVDMSATARANGVSFDSSVQNQRAALALLNGTVYVAYGGHFGDCGSYRGWVVGISTANPSQVTAFTTAAQGGGIWGPAGIVSDGTSLFVSTGNTFGASAWSGGEAVFRLTPSLAAADSFAPSDWKHLDDDDLDLGGAGVSLVGNTAVALGKDGKAYLLDKASLGGVGGEKFSAQVSDSVIIGATTVYQTPGGSYLAFRAPGVGCPSGQSGELVALRVQPASASVAWCADPGGRGSPMATHNGSGAAVWVVGAQGDNRLHAFDGDTGAPLGTSDVIGSVRAYQTPMPAKGRVYVGAKGALVALGN